MTEIRVLNSNDKAELQNQIDKIWEEIRTIRNQLSSKS
jgi:hypothetical protein